ncbi:efflux RND transporter periplasmic adaptor subunit [Suttonella ornithocola]|uniref:Acriflavine resistance protein A n=1 Tax=Suttonella ornithocola TaxID=279832 RepID=A0A380N060_9GAMM|nr:efflux RND transporter periplasmic adaptor subunit [Suttonella ornithocola]SUO97656.1 Acriflavine resistance protein A precursor [Suttonella ornithocola]
MKLAKVSPLGLVIVAATLGLTGCDKIKEVTGQNNNDKAPTNSASAQKAPPAVVSIITAKPQTVTIKQNLPARLEASREAVIVPRISGIVEKRLFTEGSEVRAGQPLYQIDTGTYRAALLTAQANLKSAQASLGQAKANRDLQRATVNRYAPLVKANAISRQEYDNAVANLKVQESNIAAANAQIAAAKAAIDSANISLGYAGLNAPISGRIGRSQVSEGAYVTASNTQMAKIQQLNPMYLNITQSADAVLKLKNILQNGQAQADKGGLEILLEDGSIYPQQARLLFVDQTVNETTGELTLRAEVANPKGDLLPGLYVRVVVPQASYPNAYLIPQQAVTRGEKNIVMVVEEDGSFHPVPVTIIGQQDNQWIITDGLKEGMKIIVEGLAKAGMMGAKTVQTKPWQSDEMTNQAPEAVKEAQSSEKSAVQ